MISEEIENELEALKSIYGEDFEEKPPVWKRPCFCIRVKPTTSTSGAVHVEATLKFTLVNGYPKIAAKVEVESSRGLSASDTKTLTATIQTKLGDLLGQEMCHEIITCAQQFLEANNVKPQTFYEAMISREKRESEALKNLRGKDASSDGTKQKGGSEKLGGAAPTTGKIGKGSTTATLTTTTTTTVPPALDFKQSTEFISQQRLLNKASTRGAAGGDKSSAGATQSQSPRSAPVPTPSSADNSDSVNLSSLNASMASALTSKTGKSAKGSSKSWLKLFVNQSEDGDGTDEGSEGGHEPAAAQPLSLTSGNNRLVPVIGRNPQATDATTSRYAQEFHELSRLGAGASGQVWKVRNKLDRRIYAVKKIDLNASENASVGQAKIRREVTTISRLLHKHIVRYYAAWVEESAYTGGGDGDDASEGQATATITGASGASGVSSTQQRSGSSKSTSRAPAYLSAVVGGGIGAGSRYSAYGGMEDLDGDYSYMYNPNPDDLWTFEDSSGASGSARGAADAGAVGVAKKAASTARGSPRKGGFFSTGSSSSSSDSDSDSSSDGSESSSSDEESSDSSSDDDEVASSADTSSPRPQGSPTRRSAGLSGSSQEGRSSSRKALRITTPSVTSGAASAAAAPRLRRWMFIQMEYCYTTLREVIDQGQLWQQPTECGKLLRQMLEALVYIHDRRVIHRDLKPANIFLDAEGNIKIGDFGLATFTADSSGAGRGGGPGGSGLSGLRAELSQLEDSGGMSREASSHSLAMLDTNTDALSNSLTGGIGTAMYRAPEQEYRAAGSVEKGYDEKADLFSLGVILFEMCHAPFGTGMERLLVMKRLRESAELPAGFGETYSTEAMASVVKWLVQHDPSQRPTAAQLLASPLVPARVDTDSRYLKEITEALWKPNSSAAASIISVLFNNSLSVQKAPPTTTSKATSALARALQDSLPAVSYDLDVLQHSLNALQPRRITRAGLPALAVGSSKVAKVALRQALLRERSVLTLQYSTAVKQRLRAVFEAHGAVPYSPGLLQLRSNPGLSLMMRKADRAVTKVLGGGGEAAGVTRSPALAQFLDPVGQVVVLPSDLVTPFAKLVAFLNLQHSQRYNIGQVYTSLVPPDSPEIIDTPAVVGHNHPFISEEAVFDVVLPLAAPICPTPQADSRTNAATSSEQSLVLQADFEVLTAAIEAMSKMQAYLPDCAIRVTDPRIMDAVIELCSLDLSNADTTITTGGGSSNLSLGGDQYDRESLFKIISLASDGVLPASEVTRLITELRTPPTFQKRLLAFVPVFCTPQSGCGGSSGGRDPLQLLDALEQEFYRSEPIVELQRRLASGSTTTTTTAGAASTTGGGTGDTKSVAGAKGKKTVTSAAAAPDSTAATAVTSPVADFTQLNLNHIGKQQTVKKSAASATTASTAAAAVSSRGKPAQPVEVKAPVQWSEEDAQRDDRRRIRAIIKTFDAAVSHLRALVKAGLQCLYGTQQTATSVCNSLLLIVDLGKDPRYISSRAGSSMLCPFHARGVYFVLESYLFPSEQYLEQQLQAAREKGGAGSGTVDPTLLLKCCRRRHNRFGGVMGEAGHFEHLVEAYREHFTQAGSGDANNSAASCARKPAITACALRLKLDVITQLISKYESRQRKVADHVLTKNGSHKYHFAERFRTGLAGLLEDATSVDVLLAVDSIQNVTAATSSLVQGLLLLLRRHGIRAGDRPHQLQGASQGFQQHLEAAPAAQLCVELGIPFVLILPAEGGNQVTLQHCGDGGGEGKTVTVTVADVPRLLQASVRAVRQESGGKFSLPAILAAISSGSDGSTVRSPGRAGGGGGGSSGTTAGSGAAGAADAQPALSTGAGKHQKVRFGTLDLKHPSSVLASAENESPTAPPPLSLGQQVKGAPVERIVHVVNLDTSGATAMAHGKDWQPYNNPKEKKQAAIKKKEYDLVPQRVRALMMQTFSVAFAGAGVDAMPNVTPLHRSLVSPYLPGVVLVVDAPYGLLRDFCTILMTKLHSAAAAAAASAREAFESLPNGTYGDAAGGGAGNSAAYRKVLKMLMSQLCTYAKQITSGGGGSGSSGGGGSSGIQSGSGKGGGGSAASSSAQQGSGGQGSSNTMSGLLQVYLYSLSDQQMDLLSCEAKALLSAKFV